VVGVRARASLAVAGFVSLVLYHCGPLQGRPKTPEPVLADAGIAPGVVDPGELTFLPGQHEYELQVAGQGPRAVEVWMPEAGVPRTLVLLLHGTVAKVSGVQGLDAHSQTRALVGCLAAPALGGLDPIILSPRSSSGQWWSKADTELVLGLVVAVRSRWPAAGARSVIAGYSNGGIGTWYFARLYPEYFSAAVPIAFNDTIVGASPLPIYAIQGTKDEQFRIDPVREAVSALKATGQDVTWQEKYRGSHYKPCSYVPELAAAGDWLEAHVFGGRVAH
jgi:poly(3-hydroxybutyrate) depolymerase